MKKMMNRTATGACFLLLFFALAMTSCAPDEPMAAATPAQLKGTPTEQIAAYVEAGNVLKGEVEMGVQTEMIDLNAPLPLSFNKGGACETGDCCCTCQGSITFNSVTAFSLPGGPTALWSMDLIATCSSDPNSVFGPDAEQIATYDHVNNPIGSTATFEVLDEHYYWMLAILSPGTVGVVNVTLTDPVTSYTVNVPGFNASNPSFAIKGHRLNCDLVSYSNCYDGGERVCCL